MQMRRLGKGGLEVSGLGLGCMAMTSLYGPVDEAEAIATVREALDAGANFLDTADAYADGKNEELLARALADGYRAKAVVATKFGNVRTPDGKPAANGKPEYVIEACNKSLARLKIDAIDLYFQHRVDASVPIEDTVGAMKRLVEAGQGSPPRPLRGRAGDAAARQRGAPDRCAADRVLGVVPLRRAAASCPVCRALGVGFVPYSPLGRGMLTGAISSARRPRRERPPPRPSALPGREPRAQRAARAAADGDGGREALHAGAARARVAPRARAGHGADPGHEAPHAPAPEPRRARYQALRRRGRDARARDRRLGRAGHALSERAAAGCSASDAPRAPSGAQPPDLVRASRRRGGRRRVRRPRPAHGACGTRARAARSRAPRTRAAQRGRSRRVRSIPSPTIARYSSSVTLSVRPRPRAPRGSPGAPRRRSARAASADEHHERQEDRQLASRSRTGRPARKPIPGQRWRRPAAAVRRRTPGSARRKAAARCSARAPGWRAAGPRSGRASAASGAASAARARATRRRLP